VNVDRMNDTSNEYGSLRRKPIVKCKLKKRQSIGDR
jgi:hypothetical protein